MKDGTWYWKTDKIDLPAAATLTPLNGTFAVAGGRGYFRGDRIADSDGATFQALDEAHAKDARQVWYCDTYRNSQEYFLVKRTRATVIDPATFEVLYSSYARDRLTGYYMREVVATSDGATFEGLSVHFAKDKAHVWYSHINMDAAGPGVIENLPLPDADPATFVAIEGDYGKDAKRVYRRATVVPDAHPPTFTVPR